MIQTVPEVRHEGFLQQNQSKGHPAELLPSIGSLIDIDPPPGELLRSYRRLKAPEQYIPHFQEGFVKCPCYSP